VHYTLTWKEALAVLVTAVGMYAAMLLIVRLAGRRIVSAVTAYDLAAGLCLGSIMGRSILGSTPALPAGAMAFAILLGLHCATRAVLRRPGLDRLLGAGPVLVMRDGQVLPEALSRTKLTEDDLRAALRRASIGSYVDVGAAVVERTGTISVLRHGQATADVLAGVEGWS
jgi:uncharacterized membrane protein YcaP (DUF421 family)